MQSAELHNTTTFNTPSTTNYVDLTQCCRLCLQVQDESNILDMHLIYDMEECRDYYDCFKICTKIDMRAAGAHEPRYMCKPCGLELQVAYDFYKKVEESTKFLQKVSEIKTEDTELLTPMYNANEDDEGDNALPHANSSMEYEPNHHSQSAEYSSVDKLHDKEPLSGKNSLNSIVTELKCLRSVITHLSEDVINLRHEFRETQPNQPASETSHLPELPFNEKEDFNNFVEELVNNKDALNEFKTYLIRLGRPDTESFLRAAMRAIFTDNLAQQFAWKGTKTKAPLISNFVVTVIKGICLQKFPYSDHFRINSIIQKHLIYAKDRTEKRQKRNNLVQ